MREKEKELGKMLHDFKSPLSSMRTGLLFILEGRAGKIDNGLKKLIKDVLGRNQKMLDLIQEFEKNHV